MAYVVKQLYKAYRTYLIDYSGKFHWEKELSIKIHFRNKNVISFFLDPRSDHLPMVNSPLIIFGIISGYLWLVLSVGPRFMQNRAPFQIKNIIIAYNAFQIVANIFVWFYVRLFNASEHTFSKKLYMLFIDCDFTIGFRSDLLSRYIQSNM